MGGDGVLTIEEFKARVRAAAEAGIVGPFAMNNAFGAVDLLVITAVDRNDSEIEVSSLGVFRSLEPPNYAEVLTFTLDSRIEGLRRLAFVNDVEP